MATPNKLLMLFVFFIGIESPAQSSDATAELIKSLYSEDFKLRAQAATTLSATKDPETIKSIISNFRRELSCVEKTPRPKQCHDPKFVYNVILVAGNLAKKDSKAPWDFLVNLWRGGTVNEGSFFQSAEQGGEYRGADYFTPSDKTSKPTMTDLQTLLEATVKDASIWATCRWPKAKIFQNSKKKDFKSYQIYSYDRDFSPETQNQYKIRNAISWIYQGDKRITCDTATDIVELSPQGVFGISRNDNSGESLSLEITIYNLPVFQKLCSYSIESEGADPLNLAEMKSDKLLQTMFELDSKSCRPKKVPGYILRSL
jgi:hypothetical protein